MAIVFCIIWGFPTYWMVKSAFTPRAEALSSTPHVIPLNPTLDNFVTALAHSGFAGKLLNSLLVVCVAVVCSVVLGVLAAAALSRFRLPGRRPMLVAVLVIQMVPPTALLIPQFIVLNSAGLLGTHAGLILAYISITLPFAIWVLRGFYQALPLELEEAAQLDGASTWQVLTRVLFPLMMPGVISTSVFAFITAWNDYLIAYTFLNDQSRYTLPVWLASFSSPTTGTDVSGQMAASVVFSLPVVIFFLIMQRNLVSGMSAGAVK